jgi:enoyl-CoA hydratase/carnithine racemase
MSDILIHNDAGILTLTFNRVDKKNAITQPMYQAMADALTAAASDKTTRVAVIQGAPTLFTAGNDLSDFANGPPATHESPVFQFLRAISTFPKPVIAAVCGPAVGIGTTLLLHCDAVYAGDNALFSLPFANLGLCPEASSSYLLPALVGYARAAELLLFGESFSAEQALEMGLVNRIVPPGEVNDFARVQAAKLAAKPSASMIATKALMKRPHAEMTAKVMAEEGVVFGRMLREPAAKEAFAAFMQRRKPDFSTL